MRLDWPFIPILWLAVLVNVDSCDDANAFPETAANGYFSCVSCHVSPSGGGVLTPYGRGFAGERLSTFGSETAAGTLFGLADVPEWLIVGGDFRGVQVHQENERVERAAWVPMQRDLHGGFDIGPVAAVITYGQEQDKELGFRSGYARGDVGGALFVRVGRFIPRFGLNSANHTSTTRAGIGFGQYSEANQLELTAVSEKIEGGLAYTTDKVGGFEEDQHAEAAIGNLAYAATDKTRVGVSLYKQESTTIGALTLVTALGEKSILLAECDYLRKGTWQVTTTTKFAYEIVQGLMPYALFETLDGTRIAGYGVQWFPYPHFELDGLISARMDRWKYTNVGYLVLHYYL